GRGVAAALLVLGGVAVQGARFSVAAKLLGAVERLVKEVGFTLSAPDRAMFDDLKAALERGMQADALRRGWSAGAAMPYDELLERALGYARRATGGRYPGAAARISKCLARWYEPISVRCRGMKP